MSSPLEDEKNVQLEIEARLNNNESICFKAGAGSGKTYALVEAIRHLLKNNLSILKEREQKIVCITYTNVATQEISNRLGHSDNVLISTIHERLWDMIKLYQNELVLIHKDNLVNQIQKVQTYLYNEESDCHVFAVLNNSDKQIFLDYMSIHKDIYYQNYRKPAREFRASIRELPAAPSFFVAMLANVANFKKIVSSIFKVKNYQDCIDRIDSGEHKRLTYTSLSNQDRLHRMRFSHDTLLQYSDELIAKYPKLQRIIVDTYPYVFIDEYQDSSPKIVNIFNTLDVFARTHSKEFFVGYFGDTAQNIYDDGVGHKLDELHSDLIHINKIYNRRSSDEVIDMINKVRNDEIKQVSIHSENQTGSVGFYHYNNGVQNDTREAVVESFLNTYISELEESSSITTREPKIDCLILTHKSVSHYYGFGTLYDLVSRAKSIDFRDLSIKFLSKELSKLDDNILHIYKLLNLKKILISGNISFQDLLGKQQADISFYDAKAFVRKLQDLLHADNLSELIQNISELWEQGATNGLDGNKVLESCFNHVLNFQPKNMEGYATYEEYMLSRIKQLTMKDTDMADEAETDTFERLLSLNLEEWLLWYDYINRGQYSNSSNVIEKVRFHTYHGTKGAEFENVAVILEKGFGNREKNKFMDYFMSLNSKVSLDETSSEYRKLLNTQNLLYVAFSRAVSNLRVLYLDDISSFKDSLEGLFNQVEVLE